MHEKPLIEHVRNSCNIKITPYTYFTIEPILIVGKCVDTYVLDDGWTIKTNSGKDAAQFEHTMGLDNAGQLRIFTTRGDEHEREILTEIETL
jgi:methionyl aminopeptidase